MVPGLLVLWHQGIGNLWFQIFRLIRQSARPSGIISFVIIDMSR